MIDPTLVQRLEATRALLEAYERPLSPVQCDEAISAVVDFQAAVRQIALPRHRGGTPEMVIQNMGIKADEARLLLAAYQPNAQSKAQRHLHVRRELAHRLRDLLTQLRDLTTMLAPSTSVSQQESPAYVRVVRTDDQPEQERHRSRHVSSFSPRA